jgi:diguanylate cyclase (GGDEF)-like protein
VGSFFAGYTGVGPGATILLDSKGGWILVTPQRLATTGAVAILATCSAYLLGWALLWRLLTSMLPAFFVMPLTAVCCMLVAVALLMAVREAKAWQTRLMAGFVVLIAAGVLLEYLLGMSGGMERYLFPEAARALLGGSYPGRPAPQLALILLFLGLAVWFLAVPRRYRFDFADLGIGLALFLSFMILMGHLFQAATLYQAAGGGKVGMSAVESVLTLLLALSALCLNPQGVVVSFLAEGAAGAAKRRIMPAVVFVPVTLGVLQYWVVKTGALEFSLAVAMMVTANIVVFLGFSEWVSRFLARLEEERTGVYVKRESQAKQEGMTDMLTTLLNRRGWDQAVKEAEAKCRKENLNACVIVIDLDGLKRINDTEGHAKGDDFIRRAGNALRIAARREDVLARLGGDEFACLSVGCLPEHANFVLKRLSQALQKASVPASLGHAMRDLSGSIPGAFQEADQAMYMHKRARKSGKGEKLEKPEKPAQTSG